MQKKEAMEMAINAEFNRTSNEWGLCFLTQVCVVKTRAHLKGKLLQFSSALRRLEVEGRVLARKYPPHTLPLLEEREPLIQELAEIKEAVE